MQDALHKTHRPCIASVVHAARIKGDMAVPIGQAANPNAETCRVGLDHTRSGFNHVHGVPALLQGQKSRSIGLDAVVPCGQHGGVTGVSRTVGIGNVFGQHGVQRPWRQAKGGPGGGEFLQEGTARRMSHAGKFVKPWA